MKKLIAGILILSQSGMVFAGAQIATLKQQATPQALADLRGWSYKVTEAAADRAEFWVSPSAELGANYRGHYIVERYAEGADLTFALVDTRTGEEIASHRFEIPAQLDAAARAELEAEFYQFWNASVPVELTRASSNSWMSKVSAWIVPSAHAGWAEVASLAPGLLMGGGFVAVLLGVAVGIGEKFIGGLWGALSGGDKDVFPVVGTVIGVGGAVSFVVGAVKTCELLLR